MKRIIAVAAVAGPVLAGCSTESKTAGPKATLADNASTTTAGSAQTTTTGADQTTTEAKPAGPDGSKAAPLPVGKGAAIGEWEVTVTEIASNGTDRVKAANQFNDPPSKGQYMLVKLKATYKGSEEGQPNFSLVVALSGSDSVQYKDFDCGASATPDIEFPTLEPGGTTEVVVCIDAPPAAISGGTLFVEDQMAFDEGARSYWSIP